MSEEPKNQIEQLLKAYAEQRREQAAEPLELDAPTRKRLQEAMGRAFESSQSAARAPWLKISWPRLSMIGSLAALVLVATALILFLPEQSRRSSQLSLAERDAYLDVATKVTRELSQSVAESTPTDSRDIPPQMEARSVGKKPIPAPESTQMTPEVARRYGLSPAPGVAGGGGFGGGAGALPASPQATLARQPQTEQSLADKLEAGGRIAPSDLSFRAAAQTQDELHGWYRDNLQIDERFSQLATSYRRNFNSPPPVNVLNSFQVQQAGQQVRIIDADGSMYEGQTAAATKPGDRSDAKLQTEEKLEQERNVQLQESAGPATRFFFRVEGTNRTLNQQVIFEGNYFHDPRSPQSRVGSEKVSAGRYRYPAAAALIEGKAIVGGTNQVQIQAIPVPR